jgi:hypothetical protein
LVYYCAGWVSIVIESLTVSLALVQVEPLEKFNVKFVESKKLEKGKITPQLYETKTWKQRSLEIGSP